MLSSGLVNRIEIGFDKHIPSIIAHRQKNRGIVFSNKITIKWFTVKRMVVFRKLYLVL